MLTLVLGGAKSGKSRYAQSLCDGVEEVVFVATARVEDEEMKARAARHRAERPEDWKTIEEPMAVVSVVRESNPNATVLVDCVTNWLANLAWEHRSLPHEEQHRRVLREVDELARVAGERRVISVSNEIGGGIVPQNPVGRSFRDLQGIANQVLSEAATAVVLMVAGLPLVLKGDVSPTERRSSM